MQAGHHLARGARHVAGVSLQAILIAAIVGTVALTMSAVYKPAGYLAGLDSVDAGGRTKAVITVPDGVFGGTTTATANPGGDAWVHVACFQGRERVMATWKRVDTNNQAVFLLGPTPSWTSGPASCIAQEGYWAKGSRWRVLAETTFDVAG